MSKAFAIILIFFLPIGGLLLIATLEALRLHREKRKRRWLAEHEDPPACPGCGAIAGCCAQYPHCPGGRPA